MDTGQNAILNNRISRSVGINSNEASLVCEVSYDRHKLISGRDHVILEQVNKGSDRNIYRNINLNAAQINLADRARNQIPCKINSRVYCSVKQDV